MIMCTIFILTITVQFGMDIHYIMIWKVWYCFKISYRFVNVMPVHEIGDTLVKFKIG